MFDIYPPLRISGDGQLELRACYPGQPLTYSVDNGVTWADYREPVGVSEHGQVMARVRWVKCHCLGLLLLSSTSNIHTVKPRYNNNFCDR